MPRYAVFLRGINVGGTRITKDKLCAPFSALGFDGVTTFRASGNVIFESARKPTAKAIEKQLADELGFTKAVTFVRTAAEMRKLAAADPIPRRAEQKLHVIFLQRKPPKAVLELASGADPLVLGEREIFWGPEGGMLDSTLDLDALEKLAGPTTMRTKGTVDQIYTKYFA